jgi:hypothetical protein
MPAGNPHRNSNIVQNSCAVSSIVQSEGSRGTNYAVRALCTSASPRICRYMAVAAVGAATMALTMLTSGMTGKHSAAAAAARSASSALTRSLLEPRRVVRLRAIISAAAQNTLLQGLSERQPRWLKRGRE